MTKQVTLLDIAADAGVSRATVSLVMRDSPLVAAETRERVLDSAERLGYVYHRVAASLRSQRSGAVGLVITSVGNPFFAELTTGVESVLSETGRLAILGQHSESLATQERLLNQLLEYRVDGVILTPVNGTPAATIERLTASGVAVVLCVRRLAGVVATYVGSDNIQASRFEQPPLTTVATDPAGIGARAAEVLMRAAGGSGEPVEVITP